MSAGLIGVVPLSALRFEPLVVLAPAAAAIYGLVWWIMQAKPKPDPWGPDVETAIQGPDAMPVCHHCFAPQEAPNWFCPECDAAIGPFNNLMPYLQIYSAGEVLRTGTTGHWRPGPPLQLGAARVLRTGTTGHWRPSVLVVLGYLLVSLGVASVFAPVYWYFLLQNVQRQRAWTDEADRPSEPVPPPG
jgi:hypothetical protein